MCTAYKARVYPTPEQVAVLNRTFGCVRLVWNQVLAWRRQRYRTEALTTSYAQTDRYLTALKRDPECAFVFRVSSVPLQQTLRHQYAAFANFFAGRARHPRFKSRHGKQSATYTRSAFRWREGRLRLAKMDEPLTFVWTWPGVAPANWAKAKAKLARAHTKVRDARADFLHKTSARLVADHDLIVIEDLAIKNMVRNRSLARAISDCGWGEFRRQLQYKTAKHGRQLIVIDRWYPSSKTCSACGHPLAELSLSTRAWQCPSCGARHDRDTNAAKNILAAGQAVSACEADVRHSGPSRVRSAVKQEPQPVRTGISRL